MLRYLYLLGVCLLFASCRPTTPWKADAPISRDIRDLRPIVGTLEKRDQLVLREGLPHPRVHRKEFADELAAKQIAVIRDYHFYDGVIEVRPEDAARLVRILGDPDSFHENNGVPKKCDGFHPDYCVEWRVGEDVYRALVCFGCFEAKFYGPGSNVLCDTTGDVQKRLKEILQPYHRQLPQLD